MKCEARKGMRQSVKPTVGSVHTHVQQNEIECSSLLFPPAACKDTLTSLGRILSTEPAALQLITAAGARLLSASKPILQVLLLRG